MKLKGIDGDPHKRWSMWFNSMIREEPYQGLTPHKRWSMWFNSMIREEPYQGLTYAWIAVKAASPSGRAYRCCMAVVSSCCEV